MAAGPMTKIVYVEFGYVPQAFLELRRPDESRSGSAIPGDDRLIHGQTKNGDPRRV